MNIKTPSSITIEEAVSRMVNIDYIPAGLSLLEMTAAFLEEAEVNYENALIDDVDENQIVSLKTQLDICKYRHSLAQNLMEALNSAVKNPTASMIEFANDATSHQRLTLNSVSFWAEMNFGISIPEWSLRKPSIDVNTKDISWEDVTIKIWKDYKIGYSFKKGEFIKSTFRKIGLMGKEKNNPNNLGGILIGLSKGKPFPVGKTIKATEKTAISKLRRILSGWTGLKGDPFNPFNQADGWKPRFTLIDDRENANNRAKEKAIHKGYNDAINYNDANS